MNSKARYDEFFFKKDGKIHSIEEVFDEYELRDSFLYEYKGLMYCPECAVARLKFTPETSKRRGFLSTIPGEVHEDGCSYSYNYASKKAIENVIREWSDEELDDKLSSTMRMLFDVRDSNVERDDALNGMISPTIIRVHKRDGTYKNASIPRKSLHVPLDESIKEIPYIYYGRRVRLAIKKMVSRDGWEYNMLDILTRERKKEWKYKITIYRGQICDEIDEEREYRIVFYGVLRYKYGYPQMSLLRRDAIKYTLIG